MICQDPKMSMSANAKVDDQLAKESHQFSEKKIHKIRAAMEALVYRAEKVSTTKRRQFQVSLNRVRQASITWSDAHCQKAIERLDCEIHQVTHVKLKLSMNYSNMMTDDYCRASGQLQLVPGAYSPKNLLK